MSSQPGNGNFGAAVARKRRPTISLADLHARLPTRMDTAWYWELPGFCVALDGMSSAGGLRRKRIIHHKPPSSITTNTSVIRFNLALVAHSRPALRA